MNEMYMWMIFFSITVLEMAAFCIFFRSFFEPKIKFAFAVLLSYLVITGSGLFMDWIGNWKMLGLFIVFILLCHLLFKTSWKQALFFSMLYLSAAWLWDLMVVGLTWRWAPLSYEEPAIIVTYVSKSIFILFIVLIKKMFAPAWDVGLYKGTEWRRLLIIPLVSIVYGIYCYLKLWPPNDETAPICGVFALALLLIDVVFYKILQDMVSERQKLQVATLKGQKMQSRIDAYNDMDDLLRMQRKKLHDYKNQVQTIDGLIKAGNGEDAEKLTNQLTESLCMDSSVVNTKNVTVNAILNQKYHTAKERGVGMTFVVGDLSGVILPAVELIILLGNLLDNAITECVKVKEKGIQAVIKVTVTDDERFVCSVKNPVSEDVVIEGNTVVKEYEPGHGLGLTNVRDVTEKYDGSFGINCDGDTFTATVVI